VASHAIGRTGEVFAALDLIISVREQHRCSQPDREGQAGQ
jgi:hypothetical protein